MTFRGFFEPLTTELSRRAALATTSQIGPESRALLGFLQGEMLQEPGQGHGFLAEPVLEALFDWETSGKLMKNLPFLEPSLIAAMDKRLPGGLGEYRFPRDRTPFAHQLRAWETLITQPGKSVLVRTGTASGKTECFLVPILNDLAKEVREHPGPRLEGVRALFLYPLNALINSQKDRLLAWTNDFRGSVRFALYNGLMRDTCKPADQAGRPEEVLSRKGLRASPPPILVTNATMLEYMLVRASDATILDKSKGKLRWIVLDEAHTYLGSTAAEISLLLRRVMTAFVVDPERVRFVATSATIGGDDSRATEDLQRFLADLAGVPCDRVVVISGHRAIPPLAQPLQAGTAALPGSADLLELTTSERHDRLASVPSVRRLRDALARPLPLGEVTRLLGVPGANTTETLRLIDHCSEATAVDGTPLLPTRAHLFLRTQNGLWACWNVACPGRANAGETNSDWPFGKVFLQRQEACDACGSRVCPVVFCVSCGTAHLSCEEVDQLRLDPKAWQTTADFDAEAKDDEAEGRGDGYGSARLIAPASVDGLTTAPQPIGLRSGEYGSNDHSGTVCLLEADEGRYRCAGCGTLDTIEHDGFRPVRLGARFYLRLGIPAVLEEMPPTTVNPRDKPAEGRRLLTFSDSRQGTARFAVDAQREAERNFVRAFTYHELWGSQPAAADDLEKLESRIRELAGPAKDNTTLAGLLADNMLALEQARARQANPATIAWSVMLETLQGRREVYAWMAQSLRARYAAADLKPENMARVCMFREFLRRPRRQSSMETLGLISVVYPALDGVQTAPGLWARRGLGLGEWRAFLKIAMDFHVRANTAVRVNPLDILRWMGTEIQPSGLVGPEADGGAGVRRWPQIRPVGRPARLARYLRLVLAVADDPESNAEVNTLLGDAWRALIDARVITKRDTDVWEADLEKVAALANVRAGWRCPITRRFVDVTVRGFSPYHADAPLGRVTQLRCEPIKMPVIAHKFGTDDRGDREPFRRWLESDADVREARARGIWTEFSDRIAAYGPAIYFATAEHSAQQDRVRLAQLEDAFKAEKLNVLSCSTTMEMGIDIGGLNAVAMNNAPPSPANYLQRAGRAGRRGATRSVVLTMCQGSPHGQALFANPLWPFRTSIQVPRVSLESGRIVQRHLNAFALSRFLATAESSTLTLTCAWFLADQSGAGATRAGRMCAWLEREDTADLLCPGLERLTYGTALSVHDRSSARRVLEETALSLAEIVRSWGSEHEALCAELASTGIVDPIAFLEVRKPSERPAPVQQVLRMQLRRLRDEYLLRTLANEGFLPAYGFPLHVIPFVTSTIEQRNAERTLRETSPDRDEGLGQARGGWPSRHLAMAIREYAPGSGIVIDGIVYESEGVTLNWKYDPESSSEIQEISWAWKCAGCGRCGEGRAAPASCPCGRPFRRGPRGDLRQVLRPAGFAVSIFAKPTTDSSKERFVPVTRPWVSAGNAPWRALAASTAGRYRYDPTGFIFEHSAGELGFGYAICLACGRAASESAEGGDIPKSMDDHYRLRGGKEADAVTCKGNDNPYAIKRNMCLGGKFATDILELILFDPGTGAAIQDETALASIAVALRQALAEDLGIDLRELGWDVGPVEDSVAGSARAIKLFDRAEGGAGYVAACPERLHELLTRARTILECSVLDPCDKLCHRCLLSFETQFDEPRLDRTKGHAALTPGLLETLQLPVALQLLGPATKLEFDDLTTRIATELGRPDVEECRVYLGGPVAEWDMASWSVWPLLVRAASANRRVALVLGVTAVSQMPAEISNSLALRAEGADICLRTVPDADLRVGDGWRAVETGGSRRAAQWAVTDAAVLVPGGDFGMPSPTDRCVRVVASTPIIPASGTLLAPSALRRTRSGTFQEVTFASELDGDVSSFGKRFWEFMRRAAPALDERLAGTGALREVSYTDRYICSPSMARLVAEVLGELRGLTGGIGKATHVTVVTSPVRGGDNRPPSHLWHNWRDPADQRAVLEALLFDLGPATVKIEEKRATFHMRELRLLWANGTGFVIRLDQGLGFVRAEGAYRALSFDFQTIAEAQAHALREARFIVSKGDAFPVPGYVSEVGP